MTSTEIKKAAAQAGVTEDDEIGLIQCENGAGCLSWATTSIESAMLLEKRKLGEANPPTVQSKRRWNVVLKDLCFLVYVALAHFMVWRKLRRSDMENSARRREFKLLCGEGSMAQGQSQVVRGFDWRANAVANGNLVTPER